jgi:site-specific DNA recombinase
MNRIRCAIYTRKSSEEGLEQDFNSLHAQREACQAYVASQKHEGWVALAEPYDDGGISGGTLERPGLKRLMQDIEDGLVDQIVKSMRLHLSKIASPQMIRDLTSDEILRIRSEAERTGSEPAKLFGLIDRIGITAGTVSITLNEPQMVELTGVGPECLEPVATQFTLPFQRRKCGVETRLVLGNIEPELDEALIRNIAKAYHWLGMIRSRKSFDDIAKTDATSKRRVQQVTEWALLAPDIVQLILDGRQSVGLTSDWLLRHTLPVNWQDQRSLIATL